MNYAIAWSYDNYVSAHLAMGRLKEEGFNCWLMDEYTVTIDPLLTNAIGGIKLMVPEQDQQKAWELLSQLKLDYQKSRPCPRCQSHNLEFISTPRKAGNWVSAIFGWFVTSFAMPVETVYHCFDCGHEFETEKEEAETAS